MISTSASPNPPFCVRIERDHREVVVAPSGELDIGSADVLEDELRELRGTGIDCIVLDLRGLDFMDSTGLRTLLSIRNAALRDGCALTLVPGPARVQRIFELTATRGLFAWRG